MSAVIVETVSPVVYGTSPIGRIRRTKTELERIDEAIVLILTEEHPATVRSVFYRCVAAGVVPKDEARGYKVVGRRLLALRRSGVVPYSWVADGTRWTIRPLTWAGVDDMLDDAAASYRRALWHDQPEYVEFWIEKDALAAVVSRVTDEWDVPLLIARGYPSETFLYNSARALENAGKPCVVYQLGDHDPSGLDAWRHTRTKLQEFAPRADITFRRLAVNEAQITQYNLLTRPTKKSDTRARGFGGESVEVDAIKPTILRKLVRDAVESHIDRRQLELTRKVEANERAMLHSMIYGDDGE